MRTINDILCPVDLSETSQRAVEHALLLAGWYKARITALHVCNPIVIPSTDFVVVGTPPAPLLTEEELAEVRAQVARCFAAKAAIEVDVLIDQGHAVSRILERASSLPADLIVMGTHGAGGFEHLVLGSVTEKVLRKAICPVLTVPPKAHTTSRLPFTRLLCPVDFSEPSLAALDLSFSIAQQGDAEVTILHVFDPGDEPLTDRPMNVPEFRQYLEHDVTRELDALVPDVVRRWCQPTTRTARGKAHREIIAVAAEEAADLIVMGVHGRNPFDVMLFGSTTNQVVRRATCPVLTLRR